MFYKGKKSMTFIISILLIFAMTATAFAADGTDSQRKGSVNISLKDSGSHNVVYDAVFTLYKVADAMSINNNYTYEFTEDFKNNEMTLDDLNAEGLAQHFAEYAENEGLTGIKKTSLKDGTVTFDNLELGLYMAVQNGKVNGYYSTLPFIVSIPLQNPDGTSWIYDVHASPKVQESSDPSSKPETDIPAGPVTPILPDIPPTQPEVPPTEPEFPLTSPDMPLGGGDAPSDSGDPSLILTGQLNWPIPVLVVTGLLLFAYGWVLTFKKRKEDCA